MVEYPVESEAGLVDCAIRKKVCLRNRGVAPVIVDVLVAAKSIDFSPAGRASRHKVRGLIIAEAAKNRILCRKIVIDADIASPLVEFPDWLIHVVVTRSQVSRIRGRIKLNHFCGDGIDQGRRNCVADGARSLASIRSDRFGSLGSGNALEGRLRIWVAEIREGARSARVAERIQVKVVITGGVGSCHRGGWNQTGGRYAETLHFGLVVKKEKCFVFLDWAAQRSAKLVQIKLVFAGSKIVAGIKVGVPKILKQTAMKLVRSRFGCDQNRWTRAFSIFRRVVVSEDLKLLNRVKVGKNSDTALVQLIIVVAVQHPIGALSARSTDRKRKRSARRSFAAGSAIEETIWIGFRRRPRSQGR